MEEVKALIDFQELAEAREWASRVFEIRPYRIEFFKEFSRQLGKLNASSILELGSGPGFLAEHIIKSNPAINYSAFDFSPAMHFLAQERLGADADKVNFILGNFKEENWQLNLSKFDAVITIQAVHEIRHKNKTLALFSSVKSILKENGVLLYCDHYFGEGGMNNNELYLSTDEQEECLKQAGFSDVHKLLSIGSLNLWSGTVKNF